jgi:hypothetical protein
VADVTADLDAKVSTDGSHGTVTGHGGTEHLASLSAGVLALPYHRNNRTRDHVRDETREELLALQVLVVGLHVLLGGVSHLHGDQLVSLLLKSTNDFSDKSSLDAIRLDLKKRRKTGRLQS